MLKLRLVLSLLCVGIPLTTQAQSPTSSTPPTQYPTLVLQGSVSRTAGSLHESGNVELVAGNDGTWSESWTLDTRSFQQSSDDCKTPRSTDFGCNRVVPWFAPWLVTTSGVNGLIQQTDVSGDAARTAGQRVLSFSTSAQLPKRASVHSDVDSSYQKAQTQFQVTYDAGSSLPSRVDFSDYLDSGMSRKIDTYVLFSDYREESGVMVPHHIERYVQRTLQSDIHITSVTTR